MNLATFCTFLPLSPPAIELVRIELRRLLCYYRLVNVGPPLERT